HQPEALARTDLASGPGKKSCKELGAAAMLKMKHRLHFKLPQGAAPCAAVNLAPLPLPRAIAPAYSASPTNPPSPSSRSSAPASSWLLLRAKRSTGSPPSGNATPPPSGVSAAATSTVASRGCWPTPTARDAPSGFPPLQRAQIIHLACL